MSGDVIRVNFVSVAAAADSIERIQRAIDGQLSQLKTYCNNVAAGWVGGSRDAYVGLQADWDESAAELNRNLKDIALGVRTSHSNFSSAESKNTQMWTG